MKILINASNLGPGGATQVTDSLCGNLNRFNEDEFVVVLTPAMNQISENIKEYRNVRVYTYAIKNTWRTYLFARDRFLDELVEKERIEVVLSVFAPTWWKPRRPHLCGFALAHLVMPESPYYRRMGLLQLMKQKVKNSIMTFFYWRSSSFYYTENPMISERVQKLLHCKKVFTVTNYYNQVFDQPERQVYKKLPDFQGTTILTIANAYPHKNLPISIDIARMLKTHHTEFKFRFVFTINKSEFPTIPDNFREHFLLIGPVSINECPSLYEQCEISFQPTLLECFTATYPEAMRMRKPIVTTDLEFAMGLCGDAALYFDPLSAERAAEVIYKVATNKALAESLVSNGVEQLKKFDNFTERANKLIECCKNI